MGTITSRLYHHHPLPTLRCSGCGVQLIRRESREIGACLECREELDAKQERDQQAEESEEREWVAA